VQKNKNNKVVLSIGHKVHHHPGKNLLSYKRRGLLSPRVGSYKRGGEKEKRK
jgi:hypothetical protein